MFLFAFTRPYQHPETARWGRLHAHLSSRVPERPHRGTQPLDNQTLCSALTVEREGSPAPQSSALLGTPTSQGRSSYTQVSLGVPLQGTHSISLYTGN